MAAQITPRTKGRLVAIPSRGPGRPISLDTNLGKLMAYRKLSVVAVCAKAQTEFGVNNGLNNRVMSDYLNGHKDISAKHRGMLATVLGVKPEMV